MVYCTHDCAPMLSRLSNQASRRGGRYLPSMIQARYRPTTIDIAMVTPISSAGRSQMCNIVIPSKAAAGVSDLGRLKPLRAQQRDQQVDEHEQGQQHGDE